jgi:hypothetical protein
VAADVDALDGGDAASMGVIGPVIGDASRTVIAADERYCFMACSPMSSSWLPSTSAGNVTSRRYLSMTLQPNSQVRIVC